MSERPRLVLTFVGFGNVARRVVTLLLELQARLPFRVHPGAVLTARHGAAFSPDLVAAAESVSRGERLGPWPEWLPPASGAGSNAAVISALGEMYSQDLSVCVETTLLEIRAGEPATSHVRAALAARMHVVTANKGPVAFAYRELAALARSVNREFLFEGAVMDGIPIFNLVRETLPGVRVERFRGVVNSTTNHILTMLEEGSSFDAALVQMQAQGIAEADPSLDVDGWDAAAKTAALMNVFMDAGVTPHDVDRQGIRHITIDDARAAVAAGERLRLVASAERGNNRPAGRVRLERVPANDPLGSLKGQQNALLLGTDVLGEIGILQRDGGLTQTAYALVTDLATIARSRS